MSIATYPQKNKNWVQNNKIVVILGQTATGKSDLAVNLALWLCPKQAKKFGLNGAEIISADSRQIYRGLNLGAGKITKKEMNGIPHHLLDVALPSRRFSVAQYKKLGQAIIKEIQDKNKLPIICGGTGFYIRVLVDNLQIPAVKPDLKLRAQFEKKTVKELFKELKKLDPRRAKNIDRHNPRRLIRALEIVMTTGQPVPSLISVIPAKAGIQALTSEPGSRVKPGMTNTLFLGIQIPRLKLARRIKIRLQKRLKQGMIKEVRTLRRNGLSWKRLDDFGLEYRWLARYLQGKINRPGMIFALQKDIEHYAKRQLTWFGQDKRIIWIKNRSEAIKKIRAFLEKRG